MVRKHTLLLLACLVWAAAGFNILRIGLMCYPGLVTPVTPSFAIMAAMMSGGIGLRASGLAPQVFIAVFYTGLGAALLLAGLMFGLRYIRAVKA